jgi:hypothetical protein
LVKQEKRYNKRGVFMRNTNQRFSLVIIAIFSTFFVLSGISITAKKVAVAKEAPSTVHSLKVTDSNTLKSAIASIKAGDHIILANGNYTLDSITAKGTSDSPIFIEAENNARAIITGGITVLDSCTNLTIKGIKFTGNQTIDLKNSSYCRLTRNTFSLTEGSSQLHWIRLQESSSHNRIDYNFFSNKTVNGNFITFSGINGISQYTNIDHNYFKTSIDKGLNGTEAIRIGVGAISKFSAFAIVEYNLFEDCDGDAEVISSKSCDNIIRYNTIINSIGSISLRQGARCEVNNNIILGNNKIVGKATSGGIKVYGQDNFIHDNYIEKTTGKGARAALVIDSGDVDLVASAEDDIHPRVYRAKVYNNILYNNAYGFLVGGSKYEKYSPKDCIFKNNIVQQDVNSCYDIYDETNSTWTSNVAWTTGKAVVGASIGVTVSNPKIDFATYEKLALTKTQVGPTALSVYTVNEVTDASKSVTGIGEVGSHITAKVGITVLGTAITTTHGKYTITIPVQKSGTTIMIYAINSVGSECIIKTVKVLDKTPPWTPIVNIITSKSIEVSGKGEIGAIIYIYIGNRKIGQGVVDNKGNFKVKINVLKKGSTINIFAQDKVGNKSMSKSLLVI